MGIDNIWLESDSKFVVTFIRKGCRCDHPVTSIMGSIKAWFNIVKLALIYDIDVAVLLPSIPSYCI